MPNNDQLFRLYQRARDAEDLCESQAKLLRDMYQANCALRRKLATANERIFEHTYGRR